MYEVSGRRKWRDGGRHSQLEAQVLVKRVGLNLGLVMEPLGCMSKRVPEHELDLHSWC